MFRRLTALSLAVALLTASLGCRNTCGRTVSSSGGSCTRLIGSSKPTEVCYDGVVGTPVSGQPGVYPGTLAPGNGVPLLPGPNGVAPNELHFPQPSNIPPAGVPFAPPTIAPGDPVSSNVLPMPKTAVPVKNEK